MLANARYPRAVTSFARLIAALSLGCGRLAFDAVQSASCVPVGHDEDGDGIDDGCDVCPHLADVDQLDDDGDRVGTACDPEPTIARQQIVVFDPFTEIGPAWTPIKGPVSDGDSLVMSGDYVEINRVIDAHSDRFEIGGEVTDTQLAAHGLKIHVVLPGGMRWYYCELFEDAAGLDVALTYTADNGATYPRVDTASVATALINQRAVFRMDHGATITCSADLDGTTTSAGGAAPLPFGTTLDIAAEGLTARIDYFIQIRTNL